MIHDSDWTTEVEKAPEVSKNYVSVSPRTEGETKESAKSHIEDGTEKLAVGELNGEPAECADVRPSPGRNCQRRDTFFCFNCPNI